MLPRHPWAKLKARLRSVDSRTLFVALRFVAWAARKAMGRKGISAALLLITALLIGIGFVPGVGSLGVLAWVAACLLVLAVALTSAVGFADFLVLELRAERFGVPSVTLEAKLREAVARQEAGAKEIEAGIEEVAAQQRAWASEFEERLERVASSLANDRGSSARRA